MMKRFAASILALALALLLAPAGAAAKSSFTYSDNGDGTLTLTAYTGTATKVNIPAEDHGKPVTAIGIRAFFQNRTAKTVNVPQGVLAIGTMAFAQSRVRTVNLPEGLQTIGDHAFSGADRLTALQLPEGLIDISAYALMGCTQLQTVGIPATLRQIPPELFDSLSMLESITVAEGNPKFESRDGALVQKATGTLYRVPPNNGKTRYAVPEGLVAVGSNAFHQCEGLTEVTLPASVTEVTPGAFDGCKRLAAIVPAKGNAVYEAVDGVLFEKATHTLHTYPLGRAGWRYTVPEGTLAIANFAFSYSELRELNIPPSVTQIGHDAFKASSIDFINMLGR